MSGTLLKAYLPTLVTQLLIRDWEFKVVQGKLSEPNLWEKKKKPTTKTSLWSLGLRKANK